MRSRLACLVQLGLSVFWLAFRSEHCKLMLDQHGSDECKRLCAAGERTASARRNNPRAATLEAAVAFRDSGVAGVDFRWAGHAPLYVGRLTVRGSIARGAANY